MKRRVFLKALGLGCVGCCLPPLDAQAALGPKTYSTAKLLADYDANAQWRRDLYLGVPELAGNIDGVLREMRDAYEALIPDIPYIGRRNFHLQWSIPNAEKLADYLVAKT